MLMSFRVKLSKLTKKDKNMVSMEWVLDVKVNVLTVLVKMVVFARKVMTISIVIVVGHPSKDQSVLMRLVST